MADIYRAIQDNTAVKVIQTWMSGFHFTAGQDGLEVTPPPDPGSVLPLDMPERLHLRLLGLRLLRGIPFSYLVPDAAMLPSESIRFFHVDPTWVDRVIDGMISAADIGTLDLTYNAVMLDSIRRDLDQSLEDMAKALVPGSDWQAGQPITGFLMRSEAARRWPNLVVSAFSNPEGSSNPKVSPTPIPVLRHECISDTVFIALFAGEPKCVELREPNVSLRFGVETTGKYHVPQRGDDGRFLDDKVNPPLDITFHSGRVLNITDLAERILDPTLKKPLPRPAAPSRLVALHLERPPFVQSFSNSLSTGEDNGWQKEPPLHITLGPVIVHPVKP